MPSKVWSGGVLEGLDAELPLRVGAGLDGVVEVATVEVGVGTAEQLRLLPGERVHAEPGLPVELDQRGVAGGVDEPEGVHPEPLHVPVRAGDGPVGHRPDRVVLRLGVQRDEVPEGVVRRLRLGDLAVGVRLHGVDDVGELDAVLDEEHRDVVADEVEVALLGVELRRRSHGCRAPCRPSPREPATVEKRTNTGVSTSFSRNAAEVRSEAAAVADEDAVGSRAAGVHDALGDALVVEVGDLLAQVVVLQQGRARGRRRAASGRCRAAGRRWRS